MFTPDEITIRLNRHVVDELEVGVAVLTREEWRKLPLGPLEAASGFDVVESPDGPCVTYCPDLVAELVASASVQDQEDLMTLIELVVDLHLAHWDNDGDRRLRQERVEEELYDCGTTLAMLSHVQSLALERASR